MLNFYSNIWNDLWGSKFFENKNMVSILFERRILSGVDPRNLRKIYETKLIKSILQKY